MSHEEELARLRAEVDQGKEGLKEAASACRTFYSALVEEGFQAGEALAITVAWLTALTTKPRETE